MNSLDVQIFASDDQLDVMDRVLSFESSLENYDRSSISFQKSKDHLSISIKAKDVPALRASMNTYIRWTKMCLDITG